MLVSNLHCELRILARITVSGSFAATIRNISALVSTSHGVIEVVSESADFTQSWPASSIKVFPRSFPLVAILLLTTRVISSPETSYLPAKPFPRSWRKKVPSGFSSRYSVTLFLLMYFPGADLK